MVIVCVVFCQAGKYNRVRGEILQKTSAVYSDCDTDEAGRAATAAVAASDEALQ